MNEVSELALLPFRRQHSKDENHKGSQLHCQNASVRGACLATVIWFVVLVAWRTAANSKNVILVTHDTHIRAVGPPIFVERRPSFIPAHLLERPTQLSSTSFKKRYQNISHRPPFQRKIGSNTTSEALPVNMRALFVIHFVLLIANHFCFADVANPPLLRQTDGYKILRGLEGGNQTDITYMKKERKSSKEHKMVVSSKKKCKRTWIKCSASKPTKTSSHTTTAPTATHDSSNSQKKEPKASKEMGKKSELSNRKVSIKRILRAYGKTHINLSHSQTKQD